MQGPDSSHTSPTLLGLVRHHPPDQAAWNRFVDRYAPRIYAWCRAWKLQEPDAQDVTQSVLMKLARQMGRFEYDASRSFRGWLRTVAENVWKQWLADRRKAIGPGGVEAIHDIAARDDLTQRLEREFDLEVFEEAKRRARARASPQTWEAFRLTTVENLSGREAADRLGMKVAAVIKAKSNMLKRIREEVRALESGDGRDDQGRPS